jgi:hypothetical protein
MTVFGFWWGFFVVVFTKLVSDMKPDVKCGAGLWVSGETA